MTFQHVGTVVGAICGFVFGALMVLLVAYRVRRSQQRRMKDAHHNFSLHRQQAIGRSNSSMGHDRPGASGDEEKGFGKAPVKATQGKKQHAKDKGPHTDAADQPPSSRQSSQHARQPRQQQHQYGGASSTPVPTGAATTTALQLMNQIDKNEASGQAEQAGVQTLAGRFKKFVLNHDRHPSPTGSARDQQRSAFGFAGVINSAGGGGNGHLSMPATPSSVGGASAAGSTEGIMNARLRVLLGSQPQPQRTNNNSSNKNILVPGENAVVDNHPAESIVPLLTATNLVIAEEEAVRRDLHATIDAEESIARERNDLVYDRMLVLLATVRQSHRVSSIADHKLRESFEKSMNDMSAFLETENKRWRAVLRDQIASETDVLMHELANEMQDINREVLELQEARRRAAGKAQDLDGTLHNQMRAVDDGGIDVDDLQTHQLRDARESELRNRARVFRIESEEKREELRMDFRFKRRAALKLIEKSLIADVTREVTEMRDAQVAELRVRIADDLAELDRNASVELERCELVLNEQMETRLALFRERELELDFFVNRVHTWKAFQINVLNDLTAQGILSSRERNMGIANVMQVVDYTSDARKMLKQLAKKERLVHRQLTQVLREQLAVVASMSSQEVLQGTLEGEEEDFKGNRGATREEALSLARPFVDYARRHAAECRARRARQYAIVKRIDEQAGQELMALVREMSEQVREMMAGAEATNEQKVLGRARNLTNNQRERVRAEQSDLLGRYDSKHQYEREQLAALNRTQLATKRTLWHAEQLREADDARALEDIDSEIVANISGGALARHEQEHDQVLFEHEEQVARFGQSVALRRVRRRGLYYEQLAAAKERELLTLIRRQRYERQRHLGQQQLGDRMQGTDQVLVQHMGEMRELLRRHEVEADKEYETLRECILSERMMEMKKEEVRVGELLTQMQLEVARREIERKRQQQDSVRDEQAALMQSLARGGTLATDNVAVKKLQEHERDLDRFNVTLNNIRTQQQMAVQQRIREARMRRLQRGDTDREGAARLMRSTVRLSITGVQMVKTLTLQGAVVFLQQDSYVEQKHRLMLEHEKEVLELDRAWDEERMRDMKGMRDESDAQMRDLFRRARLMVEEQVRGRVGQAELEEVLRRAEAQAREAGKEMEQESTGVISKAKIRNSQMDLRYLEADQKRQAERARERATKRRAGMEAKRLAAAVKPSDAEHGGKNVEQIPVDAQRQKEKITKMRSDEVAYADDRDEVRSYVSEDIYPSMRSESSRAATREGTGMGTPLEDTTQASLGAGPMHIGQSDEDGTITVVEGKTAAQVLAEGTMYHVAEDSARGSPELPLGESVVYTPEKPVAAVTAAVVVASPTATTRAAEKKTKKSGEASVGGVKKKRKAVVSGGAVRKAAPAAGAVRKTAAPAAGPLKTKPK